MTEDQVSIEVHGNEELSNKRKRWCVQHSFSRRDFDQRAKLGQHCLFIFVNFLQQLAIISSAELISFPEEWLRFFWWLNSLALLDFLSLFDVSNDLALIFKIVVTVLTPVAITGIIRLLIAEDEYLEPFNLCRALFATLFGGLAISLLVVGTLEDVGLTFGTQQVFIFVGILSALCVCYALLHGLITRRVKRMRIRMREREIDILRSQISWEVYVWLFIFVSIYASTVKSALSFTMLPAPAGNGTVSALNFSTSAIQISGIILSLLSALFILAYTLWRARTT